MKTVSIAKVLSIFIIVSLIGVGISHLVFPVDSMEYRGFIALVSFATIVLIFKEIDRELKQGSGIFIYDYK